MKFGNRGLFLDKVLSVLVNVLVLGLLSAEVSGECGGHITSSSGTIQSPGYPKQYPNEQNCIWTVSVEGSVQNIMTSFSAFDLQKRVDGKCVDYVAIYRLQLDKDSGAVMEGKFCGDSLPRSIKIEESSMTVQFISDSDSISSPHTGFSLNFEASFQDDSSVSQATAGIVAAIFCAVVFIGVGLLRCMMMGACNNCGGPNIGGAHQNRQVVGTNDSYTFQADFPPSYSTVMNHPEQFPTPESSPMMAAQNTNGTVVTNGQVPQAEFTLQSDSSSDEDDDDSPPPYPGFASSHNIVDGNDVAPDVTNNTTDLDQTNTSNDTVGVDINEEPSNEPVTFLQGPSLQVADEQSSSTANTHEVLSDLSTATRSVPQERDNSRQRDSGELSQTDGPPEETEMVIMI